MTNKAVRHFALVVSLALAICTFFSGCSIVQPSREEMAGANYYLADGPARYTIHMELVQGSVGLVYDSVVTAKSTEADWKGEARIYAMGTCFRQTCRTLCDGTGSVKAWRGKWCKSQNSSPALLINDWLLQVEHGVGYYSQNTRMPQLDNASLSHLTDACYTVELGNQEIDWASLCDAHMDSLFGGDDFLGAVQCGTVTLYFSEADLSLDAIMIATMEEGSWLEMTMLLQNAEEAPCIDLKDFDISEGVLSEEWNMEP